MEQIRAKNIEYKGDIAAFRSLVLKCHVPPFLQGEDRPPEPADFVQFIKETQENLEIIKCFMQAAIEDGFFADFYTKELLVALCVLLGENHDKFLWNNQLENFNLILIIQNLLTKTLKCSIEDLLVKGITIGKVSIKPLLKPILLAIRPKLMKNSWKQNPASIQCYVKVIDTVSYPHLSDVLPDILPTALILTDDFVSENRVIGVNCLRTIINNVTVAELKFHGYGQLIYKALEHSLREREPALASAVIPCMFILVAKLEKDFGDVTDYHQWSRFDDVLEIVLEVIEMEHLVEMRDVYISLMENIVQTVGVRIIRWSKRVIRLLDHYLEVASRFSDFPTLICALQALEAFLQISNSCGKYSFSEVMFSIFRVLHDLDSTDKSFEYKETVLISQRCIQLLLEQCSEVEKQNLFDDVQNKLLCNKSTVLLGSIRPIINLMS